MTSSKLAHQRPKLIPPIGHKGPITSVAFSPDGNILLTGSEDYTAVLWDYASGKILHSFVEDDKVYYARYYPDGSKILVVTERKASIYDAYSAAKLHTLEFRWSIPNRPIEFLPSGKEFVYFSHKGIKAFRSDGSIDILFKRKWWGLGLYGLILSADGTIWYGYGLKDNFRELQHTKFTWDEQFNILTDVKICKGPNISMFLDPTSTASFSADRSTALCVDNVQSFVTDLASGEVFSQDEGNALALSPDGSMVFGCRKNNAVAAIWDAKTGEVLQHFDGLENALSTAIFSQSGASVLTGTMDGSVIIWETRQLKPLRVIQGSSSDFNSIEINPAGGHTFLTESWGNTARLWDSRTGHSLKILEGHEAEVTSLAYSADGTLLATASADGTIKIWSNEDQREIHHLSANGLVRSLQFSPDGLHLAAGSEDIVKIWEVESGKLFLDLEKHISEGILAGANKILNRKAGFWDAISFWGDLDNFDLADQYGGFVAKKANLFTTMVNCLAYYYSPGGGHYLLTGACLNMAQLWDPISGKRLNKVPTGNEYRKDGWIDGHIYGVAFSPDGVIVAIAANKLFLCNGPEIANKEEFIKNITKGWPTRTEKGHEGNVYAIKFSPDSSLLISGSEDRTAIIWEMHIKSGFLGIGRRFDYHQKFVLKGHTAPVRSVGFFPDSNKAITGAMDNSAKIWDPETGQELITLYQIGKSDWVHVAPSGLFDASPGAMELMHYVVNDGKKWTIIELEQLKERFYEPGLYAKVMGTHKEAIRDVQGFEELALFPELFARIDENQLHISLEERNGGIGKVSLFINSKEVLEDADPGRSTSFSVDLDQFDKYYFINQHNVISIRVYNQEQWLKSEAFELMYHPDKVQSKAARRLLRKKKLQERAIAYKPRLFGLIIGTSNYNHGPLKLMYADNDAVAIAKAIEAAGRELFAEGVHIKLLTTDPNANGLVPSRKNIKQAFKEIADEAKAEDIFITYFSGHGINHGQSNPMFYYLTKDVPGDNLDDEGVRKKYTISSNELTDWTNSIAANKQVMIFDACHSGKIVDSLVGGRKTVNSNQIRALDRMKDRTGMFVLAGSAADKVSYEATRFGQGLLTFSLLQGMKVVASTNDSYVDIMKLFQYARDEVPRFAREIRGVQVPVLAFPSNKASIDSFDIGMVTSLVNIPIAKAKPMFICSRFDDQDMIEDHLDLSEIVDNLLYKQSSKATEALLTFVNASKFKDAYSLRGRYSVTNEMVNVRCLLMKGSEKLKEFSLKELKIDIRALAEAIVQEAIRLVKSL